MKLLFIGYILLLSLLAIYSYGFVDLHLALSHHPLYESVHPMLSTLVFSERFYSVLIYITIIVGLYVFFSFSLRLLDHLSFTRLIQFLLPIILLLWIAYPAFSYDVFNYMATAKVAFTWKENPWVIMPVDISNDPVLAYTRAANKVALYGPTWIILTAIPHALGRSSVWSTILWFKVLILFFYLVFLYMLYRRTKSIQQTLFFAVNPLVLIEVLLGGHNDIVMMVFALGGLTLFQKKSRFMIVSGVFAWIASVFVKGATIVLLPLFLIPHSIRKHSYLYAFGLLFFVFLFTPFREEMYPWYAVWFIAAVTFLPYKKYKLLYSFCTYISFGLLLRHAPYIYMGYYEGPGPLLRMLVTIIPICFFFVRYYRSIIKEMLRLVSLLPFHRKAHSSS